MPWRRPQVPNEKKQVSDDYEHFKQTVGRRMQAVQLRSSRADRRPCDALRRYVQRASARAAEVHAQATRTPRTRWAARVEEHGKPSCMPSTCGISALRLYVMTRFAVDEMDAHKV